MNRLKVGDIVYLRNKHLAEIFNEGDIYIFKLDRTPNLRDYKNFRHCEDDDLDIIQVFRKTYRGLLKIY